MPIGTRIIAEDMVTTWVIDLLGMVITIRHTPIATKGIAGIEIMRSFAHTSMLGSTNHVLIDSITTALVGV